MTARIAVFTNQYPSKVNTFFARDMRALLDAGFEIDIFPLYPLDASLWRYVPDLLSEQVLPRTRVHHLNAGGVVRAAGSGGLHGALGFVRDVASISASAARFGVTPLAKSAYAAAKAWAWARSHDAVFDHVLAYWGNYAATAAYLFQRLQRRPVSFSTFLHAGTDLYRDQVFLKQKLLHADNIVVVCDFNRQFVRQRYADVFDRLDGKMHLHHLGLDFAEFAYRFEGRHSHRLLGVGSFEKVKGYDYLVRALHLLKERGVPAELELVGDGTQMPALRALANELGVADAVTFRGWLTFDEVKQCMAGATILVHPSTGLGDAVPTVIKEAMALGTPVVASDVVGIPELLDAGRCGRLVPPRDAAALADALAPLLASVGLRQQIARAARAHAEATFDQSRNGRALAELFQVRLPRAS